jgi:hypothetical protein
MASIDWSFGGRAKKLEYRKGRPIFHLSPPRLLCSKSDLKIDPIEATPQAMNQKRKYACRLLGCGGMSCGFVVLAH